MALTLVLGNNVTIVESGIHNNRECLIKLSNVIEKMKEEEIEISINQILAEVKKGKIYPVRTLASPRFEVIFEDWNYKVFDRKNNTFVSLNEVL